MKNKLVSAYNKLEKINTKVQIYVLFFRNIIEKLFYENALTFFVFTYSMKSFGRLSFQLEN